MKQRSAFLFASSILVYAFLYVPLMVLIFFSFNAGRDVTIWKGFSTKWYGVLMEDDYLLNALGVSLRIAFQSATFSVIIGTMAAVALVRFGRFRGRTLFSGMTSAPLVMPDVITGLALLFMFVSLQQLIGWPGERGVMTVTIAHTTLAMAYVTAVVRARLVDFDGQVEEAAQDLGARPLKVFFLITLPMIAPSLASGWLLAFLLSMDDVVVASFVSGPGATTLPMVIFSSVKLGVSPKINALATLLIFVVSVGICIAGYVLNRTQRNAMLKK